MFPSRALVKRELLTSLRRTRIFVWLVLVVLCCIAVVWFNWPEESTSPFANSLSMTIILYGLTAVLLGGCLLFIPAAAASAIVSEREQDTLDLLRMSLMRNSGIVFAKLLNAVGLFMLMVIAAAPTIGTTLFGVGFDTIEILQLFITILTVAMTCALAGLASSAFFRRTVFAVLGAYVLAAVAFVLPGMVTSLLAIGLSQRISSTAMLSPIANYVGYDSLPFLGSPLTSAFVTAGGTGLSSWWMLVSVLLQVPFWIIFAALTMHWLRRRDTHAIIENEELIDDQEILRSRRQQFPYYLVDPLKRKRPIEDSLNPMLVREIRWGLFSRMTTLMRLCLAIFTMFFIASLFSAFYDDRATSVEIVRRWAAVQYLVTMLFAPALVANSFTKEIELGNLDMMRMTLMRPRQILAGKAGAGFVMLSPIIVAVLVASFPLLFIGIRALPELAASTVTGIVWAAYCVAVSVTASLFAKRTLTALIASYGIVAFTYLMLNPLVDFFWDVFKYRARGTQVAINLSPNWVSSADWIFALKMLNPTTAALDIDGGANWYLNTSVALAIIALCYGVAAFVLTRYRMQDR